AVIICMEAFALCTWLEVASNRWDPLFLGLVAALLLTAPTFYPAISALKVSALGRFVWFRLGVTAILKYRHHERLKFGFFPSQREWIVGIRSAVFMLPVAITLNLFIQFAKPQLVQG